MPAVASGKCMQHDMCAHMQVFNQEGPAAAGDDGAARWKDSLWRMYKSSSQQVCVGPLCGVIYVGVGSLCDSTSVPGSDVEPAVGRGVIGSVP